MTVIKVISIMTHTVSTIMDQDREMLSVKNRSTIISIPMQRIGIAMKMYKAPARIEVDK